MFDVALKVYFGARQVCIDILALPSANLWVRIDI